MLDIKKEREKRGLTQEDFASLLGVSRKTIVNYESGGNIPDTKEKIFKRILSKSTQTDTLKTPEVKSDIENRVSSLEDKMEMMRERMKMMYDQLLFFQNSWLSEKSANKDDMDKLG